MKSAARLKGTFSLNMFYDFICITFCTSDGDIDSLLDSASVYSNEASPLSNSHEAAEDKSLKNTQSPKDTQSLKESHSQSSKDALSPKEAAPSPKDICSGKKTLKLPFSFCLSFTFAIFFASLWCQRCLEGSV